MWKPVHLLWLMLLQEKGSGSFASFLPYSMHILRRGRWPSAFLVISQYGPWPEMPGHDFQD